METITIFTSGIAQGEPGAAAIGAYSVDKNGKELYRANEQIGNGTATYAAYYAVLRGLQIMVETHEAALKDVKVEVCIDNEQVYKQLNHECQIKDIGLASLFIEVHNLRVSHFPRLVLTYVTADLNKEVISLAKEALSE